MADLVRDPWIVGGALAVVALVVLLGVMVFRGRRQREDFEHEQQIRRSQTFRVMAVVVLMALIVLFAAANRHEVAVNWIMWETRAPMVLVVVLSGGIGFLIGALVAYRSRASRA